MQGWELFGSAQRVQTQLLGGEWAIFGDGLILGEPAFMVFGPSSVLGPGSILGVHLPDEVRISSVTFDVLVVESDGLAEPEVIQGLAIVDAAFVDVVLIPWNLLPALQRIGPDGELIEVPVPEEGVVAFIDNITFHTIPEPSVLGMLVMGGVAVLTRRRAQGGRLT